MSEKQKYFLTDFKSRIQRVQQCVAYRGYRGPELDSDFRLSCIPNMRVFLLVSSSWRHLQCSGSMTSGNYKA